MKLCKIFFVPQGHFLRASVAVATVRKSFVQVRFFYPSLWAIYRELYSALDNLHRSYGYAEEHLP